MEIKVTNVNLIFEEKSVTNVDVRYTGSKEGIFISGNMIITESEYNQNSTADELIELIKQRLGIA